MASDALTMAGRFLQHGSGAGLQSPPRRPTIQVQKKGNVRQIYVPVNLPEGPATMTIHQPPTQAVQEQAALEYVAGLGSEEVIQAQVTVQRYEQVAAGQMTQQVVEVPTVQEVATAQEVPEVQVQIMEQVVPRPCLKSMFSTVRLSRS